MGLTMSQKIIAVHCDAGSTIVPGQIVSVRADFLLSNDITTTVAIEQFKKVRGAHVFDKDRYAIVLDHYNPSNNVASAQQCKDCREFAAQQDLTHFYDVGTMGIEHALLPEKGLVPSGSLIVGADSHTCSYGALGAFSTGFGSTDLAAAAITSKAWLKVPGAIRFRLTGKPAPYISGKDIILHIIRMIGVDGALYKSMEYTGDGIRYLSMDDRFTICNMAIEAGAKNAIFPVDDITRAYLKEVGAKDCREYEADEDAVYDEEYTIDLSSLKPIVAFPHLPENGRVIGTFERIPLNQVVIGSCTNGRLSDLKIAADILKGHHVHKGIRTIIFPATQKIWLQAMEAGYLKTFVEAGCAVSMPTCGPCIGGHLGVMAAGERCLATTNRNFRARMGHKDSEVYLASPAVAAASAILGYIASPEEVK